LPEILQEVKKLDKEARSIKKDILKMCWYMRGLSYTEGMNLGHEEREIVSEIIKENLETTKKSGLPFF
jgi:mRNA-degrading endonuclease RelE of RelBE toxin-antitoxin system